MSLVVDASVSVKWLVAEENSDVGGQASWWLPNRRCRFKRKPNPA